MLTLFFFAIRFHAHTWVRWIVRDSDCLGFFFNTTYVLNRCITRFGLFLWFYWVRCMSPSLVLPVPFLINLFFGIKKIKLLTSIIKPLIKNKSSHVCHEHNSADNNNELLYAEFGVRTPS